MRSVSRRSSAPSPLCQMSTLLPVTGDEPTSLLATTEISLAPSIRGTLYVLITEPGICATVLDETSDVIALLPATYISTAWIGLALSRRTVRKTYPPEAQDPAEGETMLSRGGRSFRAVLRSK